MPPADTRNPSPPADSEERLQQPQQPQQQQPPPTAPTYVSVLSEALENPDTEIVYNLASTLTTLTAPAAAAAAAADTDDPEDPYEWLERSRERLRDLERERERSEVVHRDRSERLRRVMNRLGRLHDDRHPAYGDRVPNQNHLYDWSPSTHEADGEDELDQILTELRREQPNTPPEILRALGRSQLDSERDRSRGIVSRLLNSTQPPSQSTDTRSAAILQSVRRHPRFSARTRDSTRTNADGEHASRSPHRSSDWNTTYGPAAWSRQAAAMQRLAERRASLEQSRDHARDRDMLARVDSYRRSYLDRAGSSSPSVSPMLEQTIKYLARIRYSASLDDSLNFALDAGFLSKDYFCDDHQDFVLDSMTIPPPAESSWLAPGAVLSGCQHATSVTSTTAASSTGGPSTTLHRYRGNEPLISNTFEPPSRPWLLSQNYSSIRSRDSPEPVTMHAPQQDRWPVKVTIHSVDYMKMALSATMEAYNVPSHPHQHQSLLNGALDNYTSFTRTSSITTYLEGEILDFNTHTLLTESFKSSASNDATYWRKLPPFQNLTDEEMVRNLSSRRWFNEVLSKEWILMRWKERCFVKSLNRSTADPQPQTTTAPAVSTPPTSFAETGPNHYWGTSGGDAELGTFDDSGCGLTISGFYYVCLRRSDGKLEGLYYDPQSSPYQCLKLESVRGGVFPAWGFR